MKVQFKKWRPLYGLYVFIYLPWFFALERVFTGDHPRMHLIDTAFDQSIPFCEYFIIPYYFWFIYIVAGCLFFMIYASDREYIQLALSLIIGMSTCLIICMIYPNGIDLRPAYIPDNFFGKLVAPLYMIDSSYNVFPSIHVYNSIVMHIAINRCDILKNHFGVRLFSLITCVLICLSTMFLKQHSVVDVLGGCILSLVMFLLIYVADYSTLRRTAAVKRFSRN